MIGTPGPRIREPAGKQPPEVQQLSAPVGAEALISVVPNAVTSDFVSIGEVLDELLPLLMRKRNNQ